MKLTFLGDVMCTGEMLVAFHDGKNFDFGSLFKGVEPLLAEADYVFANLETPISPSDTNLTFERYCFCSPIEFAQAAKDAGIDFVSTANNHCLDRGAEGVRQTIKALDSVGLQHTGVFRSPEDTHPAILNINGLKIGVTSYTYGTNAFANGNWLKGQERRIVNMTQNQELSNRLSRWCYWHKSNIAARIYNKLSETFCPGQIWGPVYERRERSFLRRLKMKKDLNYLRDKDVDLSIMLLHLGGQYNTYPLESSKKLQKSILKSGMVNIIAGTHEHVTHGGIFNRVNENQIATYSLGNFNSMSGTFIEPFGKFAEYSVAWHVYINEATKKIAKSTFTILKTLAMADGKIQVSVCHDLLEGRDIEGLKENIDREQLLGDMQTVAFRFTGRRFTVDELKSGHELTL